MTAPANERILDVVVIGGGLAGVRTALGLHDADRSFVLLEANDRLGGRVKTIRDPALPGGVFDVGARQIGQGYRRTLALIDRFGLETVDEAVLLLPSVYCVDGAFVRPEDWKDSAQNPFPEAFRSIPLPLQGPSFLTRHDVFTTLDEWRGHAALSLDVPVADHMRADGYDDDAIRLTQLSLGGIDPERTSMLTLLQEHHRLLDELRLTSGGAMAIEQAGSSAAPPARPAIQNIVGGTSTLIDAMTGPFRPNVRLNHAVASIDMRAAYSLVTCANGEEFRARRVVSAVPFTALRSVVVTPAVRAAQNEAIAGMSYSTNTRVWARVKRRFWEDDGLPASTFSDAPFRAAYVLRDAATDEHTVMFIMSGDAARAIDCNPSSIAEDVIASFSDVRPAAKGALDVVLTSSWATEPHVGGLRHSYSPGQMRQWLGELDRPWHRLHFAGEHTRRQEMGMEAALESAERVLDELEASVE